MYQVNRKYLYQNILKRERKGYFEKEKLIKLKEEKIEETLKELEKYKISSLARFTLVLSIIADIIGLIGAISGVVGIFFAPIFLVLYYLDSLGKSTKEKAKMKTKKEAFKWTRKTVFYSCEIFIPFLGMIPFFSTEALIHITLLELAYRKKKKEIEEIIKKIKKAKTIKELKKIKI